MIVAGFFITKAGVFSSKTRADLTDIVIYIVLPCSIFDSFHKGVTTDILFQCAVIMLAALGLQLLVMILNRILYVRIPQQRRVVLQFDDSE